MLPRLYYLAEQVKPELPPRKVYNLLPPNWRDMIESGKRGIGDGATNSDQEINLWQRGAEAGEGIEPSEQEFRNRIVDEIYDVLERDSKLTRKQKMDCAATLHNYLHNLKANSVEKATITFNDKARALDRFTTGTWALDEVISPELDDLADGEKPGLIREVITLQGHTGTGKTSLALAIAANWPHGQVTMYQPEVSKELMLSKIGKMSKTWDKNLPPIVECGNYDPDVILDKLRETGGDPNALLIFDSLTFIGGKGDNPENRAKYERFYRAFVAMKEYVKLVLVTVQLKEGATGQSAYDSYGGSNIPEGSGAVVSFWRNVHYPNANGDHQLTFFGAKNRMGPTGKEIPVKFHYPTCTIRSKPIENEELE